jgi:hypothetical protein
LAACFDFNNYTLRGFIDDHDGDSGIGDAEFQDGTTECVPSIAGGMCGTLPSCGCPMLQVCDVRDNTGETACIPDRKKALGAACDGMFSGCSSGLTCVDGTCKKFCKDARNCDRQGSCYPVTYLSGGVETPINYMSVCSDQCDLMQPAARCGGGAGCYPQGRVGFSPGYTVCGVSQQGTGKCGKHQECSPGLGCGDDGRCHPWCRSGVPLECTPPQSCRTIKVGTDVGYYFVGNETFGLCR